MSSLRVLRGAPLSKSLPGVDLYRQNSDSHFRFGLFGRGVAGVRSSAESGLVGSGVLEIPAVFPATGERDDIAFGPDARERIPDSRQPGNSARR